MSDENGSPTAVIIPIELWLEIKSTKEMADLLRSKSRKQRLLAARKRKKGYQLTRHASSLEFGPAGFEDLVWRVEKIASRRCALSKCSKKSSATLFTVSANLSCCGIEWLAAGPGVLMMSRVWYVKSLMDDKIRVVACRYHF